MDHELFFARFLVTGNFKWSVNTKDTKPVAMENYVEGFTWTQVIQEF